MLYSLYTHKAAAANDTVQCNIFLRVSSLRTKTTGDAADIDNIGSLDNLRGSFST